MIYKKLKETNKKTISIDNGALDLEANIYADGSVNAYMRQINGNIVNEICLTNSQETLPVIIDFIKQIQLSSLSAQQQMLGGLLAGQKQTGALNLLQNLNIPESEIDILNLDKKKGDEGDKQ